MYVSCCPLLSTYSNNPGITVLPPKYCIPAVCELLPRLTLRNQLTNAFNLFILLAPNILFTPFFIRSRLSPANTVLWYENTFFR